MTDPRLSIEAIRQELEQTAETLAEASDDLERITAELVDFPTDHEYWPETEE